MIHDPAFAHLDTQGAAGGEDPLRTGFPEREAEPSLGDGRLDPEEQAPARPQLTGGNPRRARGAGGHEAVAEPDKLAHVR